ncbi:MAG: hypothetical protein KL863_27650 [Rhizobium sp.]|nr:hypothetical protein [Rhizobium sp.]
MKIPKLEDFLASRQIGQLLDLLSSEAAKSERISGKRAQQSMVMAYRIALVAREDSDVWADICAHPAWQDFRRPPKQSDQAHPLQSVIRLSVGFRSRNATSISSVRYRALNPLFEQQVPAKLVRSLLKEHGGAEGLIQYHKQVKTAEKENPYPDAARLLVTGKDSSKLMEEMYSAAYIEVKITGVDIHGVHATLIKIRPQIPWPPESL